MLRRPVLERFATAPLSICALLVWLVGASLSAQEAAGVAAHAPGESLFAAASDDVGATCAAFQRTRVGKVLCGPDFAPLIDALRRHGLAGPLHMRPAFGFDWSDLAELHVPGGLFLFPLAGDKLGGVWIFGGPSSPGGGPLAAAERYFTEQGFRRSTLSYRRATLTVFKPPVERRGAATRILFAAPDFFGVANSPEAAKAALDVTADRALAASPVWRQAARAGGEASRAGDATVVIRPLEFWERLRKSEASEPLSSPRPVPAEGDDQPPRDPLASARQLGLGGVEALAGRIRFDAGDDRDWHLYVDLVIPRPLRQALRMLELRQGPARELPAWIDAGVTSASLWRWDFGAAVQGFGNLFDEANEPGPDGVGLFEDMLDGLRDDPEGVQVDLRKDVFEQLGPEVVNVTDRGGPRTKEAPEGERTLYVVQVRDAARVLDALARFYKDDDRVQHARRGDYDLWTVPEGSSLFVEGESDSVVSVRALAVGRDQMLFGTDEPLLRAALEAAPPAAPLEQDAGWLRLRSKLGKEAGEAALWSFARLDALLEASYVRATRGKPAEDDGLAAGLWRLLLYGTADRETDVPAAAAPGYERVRGALPPAATVMSLAPFGFTLSTGALAGAEAP